MTLPDDVCIAVRDVSKCYQVYEQPSDRLKQALYPRIQRSMGMAASRYFREFWALRNVSFEVRRGETMGIIGRNGSGKSTLLQLICGTLEPTSGEIETRGRIAALLELGSGFNPEFTGRENVFMNAAVLGLSEEQIQERYERIVDFAEIEDFIDQPVKTYSSGMFMRLAFAVQAHIDASIVVIDEALTVGDVFFRQKCYSRLDQLRADGAAILLVSHSMPDIEQFCERAIMLDHGDPKFIGPSGDAARHYYLLHQPAHQPLVSTEEEGVLELSADDGDSRPAAAAFIDISGRTQVADGRAICTGVAVLDEHGIARTSFVQGERAIFYYEFEVSGDIGVPIVGMTISDDRGVIVHGKNNLQYPDDVPDTSTRTRRVAANQEVKLDLAAGEYTFEVGLAATSRASWDSRFRTPYEMEMGFVSRICHLAVAGTISIRMGARDGISFLTHHGVADLPGSIRLQVSS